MNECIAVPERGTAPITAAQWSALQKSDVFWALCENKIVSATPLRGGGARLEGFCYVGRALCGEVLLECREKVAGTLFALLTAGMDRLVVLPSPAPPTDFGPTITLIVREFVSHVRAYVGNGREWRYDRTRAVSSLIGGRMYVPTTIRLRARGMRHRVAFDRPTISHAVDLNRIVYAALREVEVLARVADLNSSDIATARAMSMFFEDCRDPETLSGVTTSLAAKAASLLEDPMGLRHETMLRLAAILLANSSLEVTAPLAGKVPLTWFLNLESLFEVAIRRRFDAVTASTVSVRKGGTAKRAVFPATGALTANPDLHFAFNNGVMVGDVKYKNWTRTADESDIYQLLTHAATFKASAAFLVYPSDRFEEIYLTRAMTGTTVWLFAVDVRDIDAGLSSICNQFGIPLALADAGGTPASDVAEL